MCDTCTGLTHPQVTADPQPTYRGPIYNEITTLDEEIANLVQALWAKGFETQASCQGWPHGSEGEKRHGTKGYILFRHVEKAILFFTMSHDYAVRANQFCPKLILETAVGLIGVSPETMALSKYAPVRGTIRFEYDDLKTLETLWTT